jgi:putative nucleotidyltransferase with HDIG domain
MRDVHQYIEVSSDLIRRQASSLLFDIYVKRTEKNFTKIFKKGDELDSDRLDSYISKGVTVYFVSKEDFEKYSHFVDLLIKKQSKKGDLTKSKEGLDIFNEMISLTTREMMIIGDVNARVVSNANLTVQICVNALIKGGGNKNLMKIIALMSSHDYQIKHSIMVSIFSIIIAKESGIVSETSLSHVGLGGFLHDIGISQVTIDPEEKEFLTAQELKEIRRHPELGKRLLEGMKGVRQEVVDIVLQHHEQPNGAGYPNGLRGPEIYHLAKIVCIADVFSSLISKRPFRDAFTTKKAIEVMKSESGRFDSKILKSFADLFNKKK